jgi:hypothetical protein
MKQSRNRVSYSDRAYHRVRPRWDGADLVCFGLAALLAGYLLGITFGTTVEVHEVVQVLCPELQAGPGQGGGPGFTPAPVLLP